MGMQDKLEIRRNKLKVNLFELTETHYMLLDAIKRWEKIVEKHPEKREVLEAFKKELAELKEKKKKSDKKLIQLNEYKHNLQKKKGQYGSSVVRGRRRKR